MNSESHIGALNLRLAAVMLVLCIPFPSLAETSRTQQITLKAGWNAIAVEVDPVDSAPAAVFDPAKVDVVARYFTPLSPVRFISDPAEQSWNAPGWGVWYAPDRADAFLTSLHAIHGGGAYLVHARQDTALAITGEVNFRRLGWIADSFNFTGFPVEGNAPPTFGQFFAGAGNKIGNRIYRLVEGSWQKVADPANTRIRPGEACWVYCEGNTNYQGPLELRFTGAELNFGKTSSRFSIEYANRLGTPFTVQVAVESNGGLSLYRGVLDLAAVTSTASPLSGGASLGVLPAGGTDRLRLELRRELMNVPSGSAVLKLSTSDGVALRIPIRASTP